MGGSAPNTVLSGTATMRPGLLVWLSSLAGRAGDGTLPRLQATAAAMHDRLAARWPGLAVPDHPALAQAGGPVARMPDGWQPCP